jgi:hypothetical protein
VVRVDGAPIRSSDAVRGAGEATVM